MKAKDLVRLRLHNQKIVESALAEPRDVLSWMGPMQAQDFEASKWAVALRLAGATRKTIEAAIDRGEILRTHLLRPTWHLVAAQDIRWLLDLTGPRIMASLTGRLGRLELTRAELVTSLKAIESALARAGQLGRKALMAAVESAGVRTDGQRSPHILLVGELEGLICSGAAKGRETDYALLDERAGPSPKLDRDEALARLALRYFASRGPATVEDFAWWSGLTLGDAKRGTAANERALVAAEVESGTYLAAAADPAMPEKSASRAPTRLLPAFDEYLIAYTDRSAAITMADRRKAVSDNGIFRPTIVVDGEVVATWRRAGDQVEYEPFKPLRPAVEAAIEGAAAGYLEFLH